MPRKKHRGGSDAPRGGGNFRGRGNGRGRGGGGPRYFSHNHDFSENVHHSFSLADEAKNTERHHGNYATNALRHSKISFVAAGHLEPSDLLKPLNLDKIQPQTEQTEQTKNSADGTEEEEEEEGDELMQSEETNDSPVEPSTGVLPQEVNIEKLDLDPPSSQSFVVDIVGDPSLKPREIKVHVPARSPSPARPGSSSSSGSEKIVFVPRKMRPGLSRADSPAKSRAKSRASSSQLPTPRAQSPAAQTKIIETTFTEATSITTIDNPVSSFTTTTKKAITEDTPILPNPFPSGSFTGRATPGNKRRRNRRHKKSTSDDDAVIEDYIENVAATMRAEAAEAGESSAVAGDIDILEFVASKANHRAIGGEDDWSSTDSEDAAEDSDAVNKYKAEMWGENDLADFDDISTDSEEPQGPVDKLLGKRVRPSGLQYLIKWEGYETDDASWILAEHLDSSSDAKVKRYEAMLLGKASDVPLNSGDQDSDEGDDDEDEDEVNLDEDLKLARLLQRQEALGITDSDLDLNLDIDDFMEPDSFPGGRASRKATKRAMKTFLPDISPNVATGFFPSASRLADAYDDFDPMEWDRPSLTSVKKQLKKKKKGKIVVLNLSDSELEENIQNSWMKDREKKKARKAEREALRAEGLLGGGRHGKKDMKAKYKEGLTMEELQREIVEFLLSEHQSLALPPMDKSSRKKVHNFASAFNLNSKSVGSDKKRFPTLYKTSRSTIFADEATIASVMTRRRFLSRPDARGSGSARTRGPGRGGAEGVVHHREGDIVGASAPEIGIENRGRRMLEKMGYKAGMALGLEGREGIVKPVEAVVKISKAGLG